MVPFIEKETQIQEVMSLAKGHTARQQLIHDLNPSKCQNQDFSDPKGHALSEFLHGYGCGNPRGERTRAGAGPGRLGGFPWAGGLKQELGDWAEHRRVGAGDP